MDIVLILPDVLSNASIIFCRTPKKSLTGVRPVCYIVASKHLPAYQGAFMLEIIQGLRSVQQQIDLLVNQLLSLVPSSGDRVAETCRSLARTPFCLAEHIMVKPYECVLPGLWLGFAKAEQVQIRQHLRADTGNEEQTYMLTISTGANFQSGWLTLEFPLSRQEVVSKRSLSISMELSSNVAGSLQFAVKSHGRGIEPRFSELVKYEIGAGTLQIADLASLTRSVLAISEEYDDVRILVTLPPIASATFTLSCFLLALL